MKLYLNDTSPFSRVVVASALLSGCTTLTFEWVDPWRSPENLKALNPFCLIPTLELDDGTVLTESLCICQHLIEIYQPKQVRNIDLYSPDEVNQLGFAKTAMEIAFRTAAMTRFVTADNELLLRGQEGIKLAMLDLNQKLEKQGLAKWLDTNLASLYLQVALDYVFFRHSDLLVDYDLSNIEEFLHLSPYKKLLSTISVESLAQKPNFSQLIE